MKFGAIIAAAGKSSRMGAFKPLLKIGGRTAVERIVFTLRDAGVADIAVITGKNAEELENSLGHLNIAFLRNEDFESNEMFDSVKIGLEHLRGRCDKIVITPADSPLFTSDTVKALLSCSRDAAVPVHKGKIGHPAVISSSVYDTILSHDGQGGLRGAITGLVSGVEYMEVDDSGVQCDMNTPADFERCVSFKEGRGAL